MSTEEFKFEWKLSHDSKNNECYIRLVCNGESTDYKVYPFGKSFILVHNVHEIGSAQIGENDDLRSLKRSAEGKYMEASKEVSDVPIEKIVGITYVRSHS